MDIITEDSLVSIKDLSYGMKSPDLTTRSKINGQSIPRIINCSCQNSSNKL